MEHSSTGSYGSWTCIYCNESIPYGQYHICPSMYVYGYGTTITINQILLERILRVLETIESRLEIDDVKT